MLNQTESQLMNRCAYYLSELAEIYESGGTDNRHIHRDLRKIEQRARAAVTVQSPVRWATPLSTKRARWVDDVESALRSLGGKASLQGWNGLYARVEAMRSSAGRTRPREAESTIRQTLQAYCAEARQFRGGPDLFRMIAPGVWGLKDFDQA